MKPVEELTLPDIAAIRERRKNYLSYYASYGSTHLDTIARIQWTADDIEPLLAYVAQLEDALLSVPSPIFECYNKVFCEACKHYSTDEDGPHADTCYWRLAEELREERENA